jgi:hypothetical protein
MRDILNESMSHDERENTLQPKQTTIHMRMGQKGCLSRQT